MNRSHSFIDTQTVQTQARARRVKCIMANLALLIMVGCSTTAPVPGKPDARSGPLDGVMESIFGPTLSPALEAQKVRLTDLFQGTPVVIEAASAQQLRVTVPLKNSFDVGRYAVKPALMKVMEHVAAGLAQQPTLRLGAAAPADAKASPRLQSERSASLRDALLGLGVPNLRLQVNASDSGKEVTELTLTDTSIKPVPVPTK